MRINQICVTRSYVRSNRNNTNIPNDFISMSLLFYLFYNLVVRSVSNQVNIRAEFHQQKSSLKLEEKIIRDY